MLLIQYILDGLITGIIYGLTALAFNIIYRAGGILNLAQGHLVCVGAFFIWTAVSFFKLPLLLGIPLIVICLVFMAIVTELIVFRPLIGQNLFTITIATVALMIILEGLMQVIWGAAERPYPEFISMEPYILGKVILTKTLIWAVIAAFLIVGGMHYFFSKTKWGLKLSAIAEDHIIAQSVGISVRTSIVTAWIISAFISAIVTIFFFNGASFSFKSSSIGLRALPVALLGGMESIWGALLAGLIVGLGESFSAYYLDPFTEGIMSQAFPFIIMIVILLVRPQGLFGWKVIERV